MYALPEAEKFYDTYFDTYFDIPEGKDHPRFDRYDEKFIPSYKSSLAEKIVDKVEYISPTEVRIGFYFFRVECRCITVDEVEGVEAHFGMYIKYTGTILCSEVTSVKTRESEELDNEVVAFNISKNFSNHNKIVFIQNPKIGRVIVTCKKLYAESLYSKSVSLKDKI